MSVSFPILDSDFVGQLIPQKFPFVMVDKLLAFSENQITAGLTVKSENIFFDNGNLQEAGLIEHMAQSVALYTGYQFHLRNEAAPTGYIGSIKKIDILRLPELNEAIETTVAILQEFGGVTLVDIFVRINDKEIAIGQMKTVLAN